MNSANPKVDFDQQEKTFISKVMRGWEPENYEVYLDMVQDIIEKQFDCNRSLVTSEALSLVESIRFKIFDHRASYEIDQLLRNPNPSVLSGYKESTKVASFRKLAHITKKHQLILDTLEVEPDLSRRELANKTGLRLQSVCGRVNELIGDGLVRVSGKSFDKSSGRDVETLSKVGV
jgi:Winged helix-turn-helix DNA-binding